MWEEPLTLGRNLETRNLDAVPENLKSVRILMNMLVLPMHSRRRDCSRSLLLLCSVGNPCFALFQESGAEDECIPISDFSFDPHKLLCCSLESGNVLSHGSGGKGYGLATTAITSGCFTWKVRLNQGAFIIQCTSERSITAALTGCIKCSLSDAALSLGILTRFPTYLVAQEL